MKRRNRYEKFVQQVKRQVEAQKKLDDCYWTLRREDERAMDGILNQDPKVTLMAAIGHLDALLILNLVTQEHHESACSELWKAYFVVGLDEYYLLR